MYLCSVKFLRASPLRSSRARPLASSGSGIRKWRASAPTALVALGSAGFVAFSSVVGQGDPTRIAAQVVSGIGFLGAGVILREGVNVRGLNTAATLWCSAMVGTFAGGGFYALSLGAAVLVVVDQHRDAIGDTAHQPQPASVATATRKRNTPSL